MFRSIALLVFATAAYAQSPADLFNRPPADVDQALRARISEFYQDQVDGKFRQAEALVADDTKDLYYNASKTKYLSFEIRRIDYSEGFTRAKAVVLLEQYVMIPQFANKPFKVPTPSTWKLINGQWYWWVDPETLRDSPWGKMTPGPNSAPGAPGALPAIPNAKDIEKRMAAQVKADRAAVTLKGTEAQEVTITNSAPGQVTISLLGTLPGVEAKLDRATIGQGEKAILTLRIAGAAKAGVLSVHVEQSGQVIPIQVSIE
jgi:hypothetical protein